MADENVVADEPDSFEAEFNEVVEAELEQPEPDDVMSSDQEAETDEPATTVGADLSAPTADENADKSAPTPAKAEPVDIAGYYQSLNDSYTGKIEALAQQYEDGDLSVVEFEKAKAGLNNQYSDDRARMDAYRAKAEIANEHGLQQQVQWLEQQHPNWNEEGTSPEFIDWLQQQPPGVQVMAQAFDAKNYAYLLSQFKQGGGNVNPNAQRAASLTAKRQASMAANLSVKSKGVAKAAGEPTDFEGLFNFLVEKDKRKK